MINIKYRYYYTHEYVKIASSGKVNYRKKTRQVC